MLKALMVATALVLSTLAPAFADHWVPTAEEPLRLNFYCTAVEDMQAYILSAQPENIPNDINCWWASYPMMGVFTEPSQGEATDPKTGVTYQIHQVEPVYFMNDWGILEPFNDYDEEGRATPRPAFIGVRPHGQNS